MSNKHQHIFAEDMADDMCQFALETSQEAFQLTITKGQVRKICYGIYNLHRIPVILRMIQKSSKFVSCQTS